MTIEKNKPLCDLTTFKIGGPAEFFVEVRNEGELHEALRWSQDQQLSNFILGEGSNILISDQGVSGLVIKNGIRGMEFLKDGTVIIGAGEKWDRVVEEAAKRELWGIENLSFVPSSAGAAPVQNIGCYGQELSEVFLWAEVFDTRSEKVERMNKEECDFSYRNSIFKKEQGQYIVLRLALSLLNNGGPNLGYRDLSDYFEKTLKPPTLIEIRTALWQIRHGKGMVVSDDSPNTAGSFFKNPVVSKKLYANLSAKYPEVPMYPLKDNLVKIPAAWLVDKICGLRGYRQGEVGVNENQAVAIVNYGNAKSKDIDSLAKEVERQVKLKTGIELEREVQSVGF